MKARRSISACRTRRGRRWRFVWHAAALACTALLGAVAIAPVMPASADTTSKPYSVVITPTSVAGGSTTAFSATLRNENSTQQLGSADITPPPGFTILPAPAPSTGTVANNVLHLRNLSLAPGASITVTFSAVATCTAGHSAWTIEAKQANNFSGPPGNDLSLDAANSSGLTTAVMGSCRLAFAASGEPAQTTVATVITTTAFNNPAGGPIEVDVLDGNGTLVTSSTAAITIAIEPAPPVGSSSGTLIQNASGGKAFFGDLSISFHGEYHLVATSPGLSQAVSSAFDIWDQATQCSGSCNTSAGSSNPNNVLSQASASSPAGYLLMNLGQAQEPAQCTTDGFNHAPSNLGTTVSQFNFPGGIPTKTLVVTIGKALVQAAPNNGVSFYEVCYQNPVTMQVIDPLPSCKSTGGVAPCVNSITKTNAGSVVETITLAGDDPNCW